MDVKDFLTIEGLHLKLPEATVEPVSLPPPRDHVSGNRQDSRLSRELVEGWGPGTGHEAVGGRRPKATPSSPPCFEAGPSQGPYGGAGGLALTPRVPVKDGRAGQNHGTPKSKAASERTVTCLSRLVAPEAETLPGRWSHRGSAQRSGSSPPAQLALPSPVTPGGRDSSTCETLSSRLLWRLALPPWEGQAGGSDVQVPACPSPARPPDGISARPRGPFLGCFSAVSPQGRPGLPACSWCPAPSSRAAEPPLGVHGGHVPLPSGQHRLSGRGRSPLSQDVAGSGTSPLLWVMEQSGDRCSHSELNCFWGPGGICLMTCG